MLTSHYVNKLAQLRILGRLLPRIDKKQRRAERDKALEKKYKKSNKKAEYRWVLGIGGRDRSNSCNTYELEAYGDKHATAIVRNVVLDMREDRPGWEYSVVSLERIVLREKVKNIPCDV